MPNTVLEKAKGTPEAKAFSDPGHRAKQAKKQGKAALAEAKEKQD